MSEVTNRQHSGYAYTMGPWGELHEGETLSCRHCQFTWVLTRGANKERGYCTLCMGHTCGSEACMACVPAEQRMDNLEAGLPELTPRPVKVFVPPGLE